MRTTTKVTLHVAADLVDTVQRFKESGGNLSGLLRSALLDWDRRESSFYEDLVPGSLRWQNRGRAA